LTAEMARVALCGAICACLLSSVLTLTIDTDDDAFESIKQEIEDKFPEVNGVLHGDAKLKVMKRVLRELRKKDVIRTFDQTARQNSYAAEQFTGSEFQCSINKSESIPSSVHRLHPSDIKVVASIGDSLTAGMSIFSKTIFSIFVQYRGHSFTAGGQDPLEKHITMPAILKKFNPSLTGYSVGVGSPDGRNAKFNVANVGGRAEEMPDQARKLVQRMKSDDSIDFKNDWKVINVFIGGNDVCDFCKDANRFSPLKYKKYIEDALDHFQAEVPRAFVNLIEVLDASIVVDLKKTNSLCNALLSTLWCKCSNQPKIELQNYVLKLQQVTQEILADADRYNKMRDDFTVVLQPFLRHTRPPVNAEGAPDMRYFAPDCFHLSALGHATAGVSLWKNMIQPIGKKDTAWSLNADVACPSANQPYLATARNNNY